ncbi:MAG: 50S ribosomal protein L24 [archaeon]|jgi:large subunit ribosomal protein L24|nr:50S ribosomal protein L24 [archaeon]
MKQEFSTQWISSKQPRKQHKYLANAPLHTKHRFLSANLSKSLREKYGKRSLPLRKGDEVLVMRGSFRKTKAKISSVDLKNTRVVLESIQRTKKDGSKVNVFFHPSALQIQILNLDDKERVNALNRKAAQPAEKTKEKK